jgi:hypothetical protein
MPASSKYLFPANIAGAPWRAFLRLTPLPSTLTLSKIRHLLCREISELAHSGIAADTPAVIAELQSGAGHNDASASVTDLHYTLNRKLTRERIIKDYLIDRFLGPVER